MDVFSPVNFSLLGGYFFCQVELTVAQIGSFDVGGSERTKRMRALRFLGLAVALIMIGGIASGAVVMSLAGALP